MRRILSLSSCPVSRTLGFCFLSFGIVTDAKKWYFLECKDDKNGKPKFKQSPTPWNM